MNNIDKIREYINALDDGSMVDLFKEVNSYNGCFDFVDTMDIEDIEEVLNGYELARAIIYGDVRNVVDPVRFNGYGNLESTSIYEIASECKESIDELIDELIENYNELYLDDELGNLLSEQEV